MNSAIRLQAFRSHWQNLWLGQPRIAYLFLATSAVWLTFGLVFKVLNLVPRHELIVARVLGDDIATPLTILIGLGECVIALWILSGLRPRVCAAFQTVAIIAMNTLEITFARDLLLAPIPMLCANVAFLTAVWYAALKLSSLQRAASC